MSPGIDGVGSGLGDLANLAQTERALRTARTASAGGLSETGHEKIAAGAQKFEELFAQLIVKEMGRALPEGFFGTGAGSDVFEGWMAEHLGAQIARNDGLHMAGLLERELGDKNAADAKTEAAKESQP